MLVYSRMAHIYESRHWPTHPVSRSTDSLTHWLTQIQAHTDPRTLYAAARARKWDVSEALMVASTTASLCAPSCSVKASLSHCTQGSGGHRFNHRIPVCPLLINEGLLEPVHKKVRRRCHFVISGFRWEHKRGGCRRVLLPPLPCKLS